jgi:hypothetical protein
MLALPTAIPTFSEISPTSREHRRPTRLIFVLGISVLKTLRTLKNIREHESGARGAL